MEGLLVLVPHIWVMGKPVRVNKQSSGMHFHSARAAGLSLYTLMPSDKSPHTCWCLCLAGSSHASAAHLHSGAAMRHAWRAAGLSINGEAKETELMRKSGLKPGQALILTKPLGSGVLFAADMRGRAKGSWVSGAQQRCVRSSL